jgi:hypothetical protein
MVRISDWVVIAGVAKKSEIAEAMQWAKANHKLLTLKWIELNKRG